MRFANNLAPITEANGLGITHWIGPLPAYLSPLQCALTRKWHAGGSLTPLESTSAPAHRRKTAPVSHLKSTLTLLLQLKWPGISTYKKHRGEGMLLLTCRHSSGSPQHQTTGLQLLAGCGKISQACHSESRRRRDEESLFCAIPREREISRRLRRLEMTRLGFFSILVTSSQRERSRVTRYSRVRRLPSAQGRR